jgi:hypothetical protein
MRITLRTLPFAATLVALPLFSSGAQSSELADQRVRAAAGATASATDRTTDDSAWFANEFPRLAWATTTDRLENGVAIRTFHRIRGVKLEGCTLTFASSIDTDSANVRNVRFASYQIPLQAVAALSVRAATQGHEGWVRVEPATDVQLVAARGGAFIYSTPNYSSPDFVSPPMITTEVHRASITVGDEAEAQRIAKAMRQAARRCGAAAGAL